MTAAYRFASLVTLALSAACTVHGDKTPPLAGPSEFSTSITVTATPDSMPQDGASQASIAVTARDANGKGIPSLRLRIDMAVDDSVQDYGILSARTITTGTDGLASAIYTAPPPPASLAGGSGTLVSFNVTPIGSNYQTAHGASAAIRLVPPGVVLPPAGNPSAVFVVTPTPLLAGVAANFDASRSCATAPPCSSTAGITSFKWTFGDGTSGSGQTTTHTYATSSSHQVTLTVTNERGATGFSSQTVGVSASALPEADFVFSPSSPQIVGTTPAVVNFNASTSKAAPGRTLAQFIWDFGDGKGTQQGSSVTYSYSVAGTYAVVLTVVDDLGARATKSAPVTVSTFGSQVAEFVFTPPAPVAGENVSFNAAASHAAPGHTLTQFIWDFGDGGGSAPGTSFIAHRYTAAGVYSVLLTVVDETGARANATHPVTVTTVVPPVPGNPIASFVYSPLAPVAPATVTFNAAASSAAPGHSLTQFIWDFGDGAGSTPGTAFVTHLYANPGVYSVLLTVVDNTLLRTTSAPQLVTVTAVVPPVPPVPVPPIASFAYSPLAPVTGTGPGPTARVTFNAAASSAAPGHSLAQFIWSFGDSAGTIAGSSFITHDYPVGVYSVLLTVVDEIGSRTTSTPQLVTVTDPVPRP